MFSGALLLLIVGLSILGRRLRGAEEDSFPDAVFVGVILAAVIWVPLSWRIPVLALLAGLATRLAFSAAWWIAAAVVAATAGLCFVVPARGSLLVLGLVVLVAIGAGSSAARQLQRMRRARRLGEPATAGRPAGAVALGGRAEAYEPIALPALEARCVYWTLTVGEQTVASQSPFEVRGAHGVVLVDPRGAEADITQRYRLLDEKQTRELHSQLGLAAPAAGATATVRWIEPDTEVYVIGTPAWDQAGGHVYRDGPPTLRGVDREPLSLADRPTSRVRRGCVYTIVAAASWLTAAVTVAALQVAKVL